MPQVRLAGSDDSFVASSDATILAAGLSAGVLLPYECASGGCGSCKARLVDGQVRWLWPGATGLSERDRAKGDRVLTCQVVPVTDCTVRVAVAAPSPAPRLRAVPATVVGLETLNPTTRLLTVEADEDFPYVAGQFVMIGLADGTRRAYSMSRPHRPDAPLEVVIRAKPGGAATAWFFERLQVGDVVRLEGPYGRAHYQSPDERPLLGIAGGSGLGPVIAIVEDAVDRAPSRPVHLYVGHRTPTDLFFEDRLADLAARGVEVRVVIEQGAGPGQRCGLIGDVVDSDFVELDGVDLYLAGPTGMIDACLAALVRTQKAAADRVFFDRFQ
jgi:NAD(P)H-flavin reductase/ferredoxin